MDEDGPMGGLLHELQKKGDVGVLGPEGPGGNAEVFQLRALEQRQIIVVVAKAHDGPDAQFFEVLEPLGGRLAATPEGGIHLGEIDHARHTVIAGPESGRLRNSHCGRWNLGPAPIQKQEPQTEAANHRHAPSGSGSLGEMGELSGSAGKALPDPAPKGQPQQPCQRPRGFHAMGELGPETAGLQAMNEREIGAQLATPARETATFDEFGHPEGESFPPALDDAGGSHGQGPLERRPLHAVIPIRPALDIHPAAPDGFGAGGGLQGVLGVPHPRLLVPHGYRVGPAQGPITQSTRASLLNHGIDLGNRSAAAFIQGTSCSRSPFTEKPPLKLKWSRSPRS